MKNKPDFAKDRSPWPALTCLYQLDTCDVSKKNNFYYGVRKLVHEAWSIMIINTLMNENVNYATIRKICYHALCTYMYACVGCVNNVCIHHLRVQKVVKQPWSENSHCAFRESPLGSPNRLIIAKPQIVYWSLSIKPLVWTLGPSRVLFPMICMDMRWLTCELKLVSDCIF